MFKTILTYQPSKGKVMDGISETRPDETMSIRTILAKFARGESINGSIHTPHYFGEEEYVPDPKSLDLVDLQDIKESNAEAYAFAQQKRKAPAKQAEGAVEEATIVDENEQVEPAEH